MRIHVCISEFRNIADWQQICLVPVSYTHLLGPEGGDGGGSIVVTGTPEEVAACEASYTGRYLKRML